MLLGRLIDWWRGREKSRSIPDELWQDTLDQLPFLSRLSNEEHTRLRALAETFLTEKEFTAVGGLQLTDAMCVSIAVQGCLPILNLGLEYYRDWVGIVVYPDEFVIPRTVEDEFGVVHEYDDIASGEAWEGGPLIISWHDVQMAGEGYNVVIHEFAHKLDMRNGEADGIPPLPAELPRPEWETTLLAAFEDFCTKVDVLDAAPASLADEIADALPLDPYAAENLGEFFAVASETFFETPDMLNHAYPALYRLFARYYRQDPLAR
ncbi:zinc-dependent peptidase [Propionivibrio sp.]|uniref:M90 family metallopeptidase n=1 Tax=Propionivibrio sp. TaxID=2212460 RepID=UPI00272EA34D|nr:M90 family metallopeptidase [Propionivibrio sp.]